MLRVQTDAHSAAIWSNHRLQLAVRAVFVQRNAASGIDDAAREAAVRVFELCNALVCGCYRHDSSRTIVTEQSFGAVWSPETSDVVLVIDSETVRAVVAAVNCYEIAAVVALETGQESCRIGQRLRSAPLVICEFEGSRFACSGMDARVSKFELSAAPRGVTKLEPLRQWIGRSIDPRRRELLRQFLPGSSDAIVTERFELVSSNFQHQRIESGQIVDVALDSSPPHVESS